MKLKYNIIPTTSTCFLEFSPKSQALPSAKPAKQRAYIEQYNRLRSDPLSLFCLY